MMMVNAAGRCNKCGTYNNLNKVSVYSKVPKTLGHLHSEQAPNDVFFTSPLWAQHPLAKEFQLIHQEFLNSWSNTQELRPKILYHYTNLTGLQGIVESGNLWFTDVAFLNDASEMQFGIDLIEAYFTELRPILNELEKELLRRASPSESPTDPSMGFFVSCFCRSRDLLSQWRAYGASGGGYALGFAASDLGRAGDVLVRRVVYEPIRQRDLLTNLVQGVLKFLRRVSAGKGTTELDASRTLPAFSSFLTDHLREFLYTFKHEAFVGEDEWRLVVEFHRHSHMETLKFLGRNGISIPYVARALSREDGMPPLPLVEVLHGPTLQPKLTKKSLHLLLEKNDYDHVEVGGSSVPLRT